MKADTEILDEVVVVAYGTATKKSFTGSATEIKGEKISLKNPTELSKALSGEVAGVQVMSTSGQPGSNASIRIRGLGSAYSSRAPLYVVDGIPFEADLSGIDPSDIASMTVLKDATATALYGSRAANGVVLITTKKGEKGKTHVEAEIKYGANMRLIPQYDVIDSPERFTELTWEGLKNYAGNRGGMDATQSAAWASKNLFQAQYGIAPIYNMWNADGAQLIDPATGRFNSGVARKYTPEKWDDYIFRTGQKLDASVKISGGNEKLTHYTAFSYLKDEGYYISSDYQRFNVRNNMSNQITPWLKATTSLAYAYMETNKPGQSDSNMNNGFQFINGMPSLFPVFERDEDGNIVKDTKIGGNKFDYGMNAGYQRPFASGINPAGALLLDKDEIVSHQFNGNGSFEAKFLKYFKITANVGLQYLGSAENELTNPYYGDSAGKGQIAKYQTNYLNFTANQILSWGQSFDKHNFDAFVAHESTSSKTSVAYGSKSKIVRPDNTEWSNGVIMDYLESYTYGYSIESYFGQLRYDYDNKYFLHGTVRADGSSRFDPDHRWGWFPGVNAAWRVGEEGFMKRLGWFEDLKVRASYGEMGNQSGIGLYDYIQLISLSNDYYPFGAGVKGQMATSGNIISTSRTWETIQTTNVGFDFSTLNNRLYGSFDYFWKENKNMLIPKTYPSMLGADAPSTNSGHLSIHGWEISLGWRDQIKDFSYSVRFNISDAKNKVVDRVGSNLIQLGNNETPTGYPLNSYFGYEFDGIIQNEQELEAYKSRFSEGGIPGDLSVGDAMYKDLDGDGKLSVLGDGKEGSGDVKYLGDKNPRYNFGFNLSMAWKGFDLSAFIQGVGRRTMFLEGESRCPMPEAWYQSAEYWYGKTWTPERTDAQYPAITLKDKRNYNYYVSTNTKFNVAYARLKNLQFGYTIPQTLTSKAGLQKVRVYFSGEDLFEVHNTPNGWDPEENSGSITSYPFTRNYSFGINVVF